MPASSGSRLFDLVINVMLSVIGLGLVAQVLVALLTALAPILVYAALLAIGLLVALALLALHMLL